MSDSLQDSRKVRLFNVMDDFNRESLAIEADTSLPTLRVIRELERLVAGRGKPANLRMEEWCTKHRITLQFLLNVKPTK